MLLPEKQFTTKVLRFNHAVKDGISYFDFLPQTHISTAKALLHELQAQCHLLKQQQAQLSTNACDIKNKIKMTETLVRYHCYIQQILSMMPPDLDVTDTDALFDTTIKDKLMAQDKKTQQHLHNLGLEMEILSDLYERHDKRSKFRNQIIFLYENTIVDTTIHSYSLFEYFLNPLRESLKKMPRKNFQHQYKPIVDLLNLCLSEMNKYQEKLDKAITIFLDESLFLHVPKSSEYTFFSGFKSFLKDRFQAHFSLIEQTIDEITDTQESNELPCLDKSLCYFFVGSCYSALSFYAETDDEHYDLIISALTQWETALTLAENANFNIGVRNKLILEIKNDVANLAEPLKNYPNDFPIEILIFLIAYKSRNVSLPISEEQTVAFLEEINTLKNAYTNLDKAQQQSHSDQMSDLEKIRKSLLKQQGKTRDIDHGNTNVVSLLFKKQKRKEKTTLFQENIFAKRF